MSFQQISQTIVPWLTLSAIVAGSIVGVSTFRSGAKASITNDAEEYGKLLANVDTLVKGYDRMEKNS